LTRCAFALTLLLIPHTAFSQSAPQPRRQFVTFTLDGLNASVIEFRKYPLEQLAGERLEFDFNRGFYANADESISVRGIRIHSRARGYGLMLYPLGVANGTTLALHARYETLPRIRFVMNRPGGQQNYLLEDGEARDLGLGFISCRRNPGWTGLGACAFLIAGTGWLEGSMGDGRRYFAEGGGRMMVGPLGAELFFRIARHTFANPQTHNFVTVPLGLRASLSF
jgi:hypothetical protein